MTDFAVVLCKTCTGTPDQEKVLFWGLGRGGPGPAFAGLMPVVCAGPAQLGAQRSLRPPLERADLGSCFSLGLRPWLFHLSYWVKPPVAVT